MIDPVGRSSKLLERKHAADCGCGSCVRRPSQDGVERLGRGVPYHDDDAAVLRAPVASVIGSLADEAKADVYGATVPTRVPRPAGPLGEPVPRAGLPDAYPRFLKPIPVNTRNVRNILDGYITRSEPQVVRVLYSTWNAAADPVKYQELRNAIRTGELSQELIEQWREDYATMVNTRIKPVWDAAAQAAHGPLSAGLTSATGATVEFETLAARMQPWVRGRGAELAVNLSDQQTQAIRTLLERFVIEDPIPPRELARYIRPVVGLTPKQTEAVIRYRAALVAEGIAPEKVINRVENYSAWLNRIRAERIARTEVAFAFNQAQLEVMRAAEDDGVGAVEKQLLTGRDDRVCPFCGPLEGTRVGLNETFPGGTTRIANTYSPPLHPSCRCTTLFFILP